MTSAKYWCPLNLESPGITRNLDVLNPDVLQVLGDGRGEAQARCHLGVILYKQGHMEKARAEFEALMALAQQLSDKHALHVAMVNVAGAMCAIEGNCKEDSQAERQPFSQCS